MAGKARASVVSGGRTREVLVFVVCVKPSATKILLLRRAPSQGGFWHCIAGGVERGESDEQAARRELDEETGIRPATFTKVHHYSYSIEEAINEDHRARFDPNATAIAVSCFRADADGLVNPHLDLAHDAFAWFDVDGALRLLHWPEVRRAARKALMIG